jgi:multicomponent Na+:H+ antiporter subunit E
MPLLRIVGIWLVLLLVWWALAEGQLSGFALVWTAVVALLIHKIWPPFPTRLHWRHLPPLILLFLRASLLGGLDVSRRAFHPQPQINSYFIDYPLQLPPGWARAVWVSVIGLFPGTLSVAVADKWVRVHVLDDGLEVEDDLKALEYHLAAFIGFGLPTAPSIKEAI